MTAYIARELKMCERCPRLFCRDIGSDEKECPCCKAPMEREMRGEVRTWFNTPETAWARIAREHRMISGMVH